MGLRQEWEFNFPVTDVLGAAKSKLSFHKTRLAFWEDRQDTTVNRIRSEGIEVHQSVAGTTYSNKASFGAKVVIDPMMQRDLDECFMKVNDHRRRVAEYASWVLALSKRAERGGDITCNADDITYFWGENAIEEE